MIAAAPSAFRHTPSCALEDTLSTRRVVMPEMGGKQLAEALLARDASLRVLFISGYTDGDISRRGDLDPNTAFLQKPFTARGLLGRVREVLDGDAVAA